MGVHLHQQLDELAAAFYTECGKGHLSFQRCGDCDRWRHLPRQRCGECGSAAWTWEPSSGVGRVVSWTVTHRAPHPGFADQVPYAVVIVELEEGVRMVSGLRGLEPQALTLDLPVRVVFEPADEGRAVPFFGPR